MIGLKKIRSFRAEERLQLIDKYSKKLSIRRQCELLSISRATYYYKPRPEKDNTFELMDLLDEEQTSKPSPVLF